MIESRTKNRSSFMLGSCARLAACWFATMLCGCSSVKTTSTTPTVARAAVLPVEPKPLYLRWDKNEPEAITEVWHSYDLQNWTMLAETFDPVLQIYPTNKMEFYRVRNKLAGQYSDWNY